jgi:hypothetical protein
MFGAQGTGKQRRGSRESRGEGSRECTCPSSRAAGNVHTDVCESVRHSKRGGGALGWRGGAAAQQCMDDNTGARGNGSRDSESQGCHSRSRRISGGFGRLSNSGSPSRRSRSVERLKTSLGDRCKLRSSTERKQGVFARDGRGRRE